jgi:hypothetical protein
MSCFHGEDNVKFLVSKWCLEYKVSYYTFGMEN